jgi:hypothetical protein
MHWVVQENLYSEAGYAELMRTLGAMRLPHDVVKIVPFSHELIPEVSPANPVIVCGAYTLNRIARARGWVPGSFMNENFDQARWPYGANLLNHEQVHTTMAEATMAWDPFFCRPALDSKSFSGQVFTWEEFARWRDGVVAMTDEFRTLMPDTRIVMSPVRDILREYRFFVVDGRVVTGSMYRIGNRVRSSPDVDPDMLAFARARVEEWQPDRAFVLDVALTDDGPKVIELNNANSAGFYACNVGKIVEAFENMGYG